MQNLTTCWSTWALKIFHWNILYNKLMDAILCIRNRHYGRPIIQWLLVLSSWLCLFCCTSLLPPIITFVGSARGISNTPCPILSNYKDGIISPKNQASDSTFVLLFLLSVSWNYMAFKKSCLTCYYQTLAELICQFLGRLDEFIFYSIISNLITTGFGKRSHFFYSTSRCNCLHWRL